MNEELKEHILKEREFLHEISNQLVIASGMASFVLFQLEKRGENDEKLFQKTQKIIKATDNITNLVVARRQVIKSAT